MRTVAVIPARAGSKGLPGKNILEVGGVPLITRAVRSSAASTFVDLVVVSTDDPVLATIAADEGALVLDRPTALCGDEASSESAVLHALDVLREEHGVVPDITVLVQCTSPFIDPADLDAAIVRVVGGEADSAFSAVETYGFLWRRATRRGGARGQPRPGASAPTAGPRPHLLETGAFYVMRTDGFRAARHRFFGHDRSRRRRRDDGDRDRHPGDLELASRIAAQRDEPPTTSAPAAPCSTSTPSSPTSTACTPTTRAVVDEDGRDGAGAAAPTAWA